MDKPDSASEVEAIFRLRKTERLYAVLWLVGGIAAFGVGAVGFVAALAMRVDQFSLHSMTTLPALCGFWAIVAALTIARAPGSCRWAGRGPHCPPRRFAPHWMG